MALSNLRRTKCFQMPLIHPRTHTDRCRAAMRGTGLLIGYNLRFSILLKDTRTCGQENQRSTVSHSSHSRHFYQRSPFKMKGSFSVFNQLTRGVMMRMMMYDEDWRGSPFLAGFTSYVIHLHGFWPFTNHQLEFSVLQHYIVVTNSCRVCCVQG